MNRVVQSVTSNDIFSVTFNNTNNYSDKSRHRSLTVPSRLESVKSHPTILYL